MINRLAGGALRRAARAVRRHTASAGRSLSVYPDDLFITSYPRSGNTWVRFIVANLLWADGSTDFRNIDQRIPGIYGVSEAVLSRQPRPRILKSHEYFDPRYPKVLYIVRDARSVLVSYYHYRLRRGQITRQLSYLEFAEMFVRGDLDRYGTWRENVLSWISLRGSNQERFRSIRYEDLKRHALPTLRQVVSFLGLQLPDDQLQTALERSSFERLSKLERLAGSAWKEGRSVKSCKAAFIRSGKVDEWRDLLDAKTLTLLWGELGDLLLDQGYQQ